LAAVAVAAWRQQSQGSNGNPLASLSLSQADRELSSNQIRTRLAAIAELQGIMRTQPGRQPAVIRMICKFITNRSPESGSGNDDDPVTADIQAALAALAHRNPAHDGGAIIGLNNVNLTEADLAGADLAGAALSGSDGADLTDANLRGANLRGADLANAYLGGADLIGTNLSGANLTSASFNQTQLCSPINTPTYPARGYDCQVNG
jgi:pentapeptide repeat protein